MKPILFNTKMVQAILDGRKTTTRRIIKDNQCFQGQLERRRISPDEFLKSGFCKNNWDDNTKVEQNFRRPYDIGDILYIRETWFEGDILDSNEDIAERNIVLYRTDDLEKYDIEEIKWRPSIHMPKRLARIFLKVTSVRVERLQDITEQGIKAEGITEEWPPHAMDKFQELWDSTTKEYKWTLNPWVWVIEFERCDKPNER